MTAMLRPVMSHNTRFISGIGSRETPIPVLREMEQVGAWVRSQQTYDLWLRSGHADGADHAFERGAQDRCIAYLPWATFNSGKAFLANKTFSGVVQSCPAHDWLVTHFHPTPSRLSPGAVSLHRRNGPIILGPAYEESWPVSSWVPSNAVVCWTRDAKVVGGTGQGLRIAKAFGVPIINMAKPECATAFQVISMLELLLRAAPALASAQSTA